MKLAIMQPYFFPYIGYFQLINAVDKFIIYDDVNFIKNGWINRNRIIINDSASYITVQLKNASSFKLIKDIEFSENRPKLLKTIEQAYKKAPYYSDIFPIIQDILNYNTNLISELAIYSIQSISNYLQISKKFELSHKTYLATQSLGQTERILEICKINKAQVYINPIGGIELYSKELFKQNGIDLYLIKTNNIEYRQFKNEFIPWLSIIDVMMFNSPEEIRVMLDKFTLL